MPIPQKAAEQMPKTIRERVYTELRKWIIDGTLKPGEKISDLDLSVYFSTSRTPVREAIQLLADQKLIEIYPGKETIVAPIDLNEVHSLYQIAAELHVLALEFAYPHITQIEVDALKKCNQQFTRAIARGDNATASQADHEFHDIIIKLSSNYFIREFIKILSSHIERLQLIDDPDFNLTGKKQDSVEDHENIIKALENQDLESAKEAMRHNWLHTIEVAEHRQP